ncbi:hypothetical protein HYH02_005570 [Chlamydomonas schloesseri]|uniref:Uncharacterized protein n=1 Tax=Chlamydomonas schloesseri TaxID=2026947 RepID=A0A836B744_9CHLO|nr:hypothetical protein HYH02_005570 [Chlamydomonas schloesseri]|eukprot:KAG2449423.1 hypothetical protein HYH02_005570 [Chlamydomonas schloesseri]
MSLEYCLELREVRGAPQNSWLVLEVIVRTPRLLTTVRRKYASKPFHASKARGVVVQWLRPSAATKGKPPQALVRLKLLAGQGASLLGDAGDVAAAALSSCSELHKSSAADVVLLQQGTDAPAVPAAACAQGAGEVLQCACVQLQVPPQAIAPPAPGEDVGAGGIHGATQPLELDLELYYVVRPATVTLAGAAVAAPGEAGVAGTAEGHAGLAAGGGHAPAAWGETAGGSAVPPTPSSTAKKRTWLSALGFSRSGNAADSARSAGSHAIAAPGPTGAAVAGGAAAAAMDLHNASSAAGAGLTGAWSLTSSLPTPAGAPAPSGTTAAAGVMGSFGRAELPSGRWQGSRPSLPSAISSAGRGPTTFAAAAAAVMSATGMSPSPALQPLHPREAAGPSAPGPRLLTAPGGSGSMWSDVGDGATPTTAGGGLTATSSSIACGSTPLATATPMALSSRPSTLPPESQTSQQLLQPPKRRRLGDLFARLFGTSNHGLGGSHAAAANGNGGSRGRAAGADGAASASAAGAAASAGAAGAHATLGTTTTTASASAAGASPHSTGGSLRRHPSLTNLALLVPPSPCLGDVYRIQDNALASEAGVQVGFGSGFMTSAFQQAPAAIQAASASGAAAAAARLPSGPLQHSGGSGRAAPVPMQIQPSTSASLPGLESPGAYAGELSPAYRLPPGSLAVEPPTGGLAAASLASPAGAAVAAAAAQTRAIPGTGAAEDVMMQQAAAADDAAGVAGALPHLPQPSPMAASPGAPPGGCFLFWRYGSATARKQQQQQQTQQQTLTEQLQLSQEQPACEASPAAAMGRAAGLHSGPASSSGGIGRNPAQLRTIGRPVGRAGSASATPTHSHAGQQQQQQHYLDQHGAGSSRGGSAGGAVPPGFASTSVGGEAGTGGIGRRASLSAGASTMAGSEAAGTTGAAAAPSPEAEAAATAPPHPLEAEVHRVMGWVTGQTGAGGMDEDVRVSAISQCQFLLDCLHNPDMAWLVPDSLLQLKHEVGFPFDSGVPIAGAPGWYRLVIQPMQLPQPPQLPQHQLPSPRPDEGPQQQPHAGGAAATDKDGHAALAVPAVTRPMSLSGGCLGADGAGAQQPEVLKVRWSSIDQRAAGGANACAAIALEVALWCLAAMQRWRAATSAAAGGAGGSAGSGQHERRGSGSGGGGGAAAAAFGANGRTGSFEHHTSNGRGAAGGGSHSRGLLPVLSRSQRERIASASGIDMDAMSGTALEEAIRTGTAVWTGLLATSPAARVASSTGDFDLEHMLQLGGYGERLRLAEYIAATLIQPPPGAEGGGGGGGGGAHGRRTSRESAGWDREEAGSRRLSRDGPGSAAAAAAAAATGSVGGDAVAVMAAAAAAGSGGAAGAGAGSASRPSPQPPTSPSPPLLQGSLMFPTSLPLTPPSAAHHDSPGGMPGAKQPAGQRATPGSEAREAPGTGGSVPGSHSRPPRPPRPPPLLMSASPDGASHHVPHPPSMPPYRVSQNGVPYFASLVRSLQQGVYVLGVHGHFTTLWLRPGGQVHVIDSLGARLAADCPLGFIAEFDCPADFLRFFLARHGVRGQAAAADADDISGGNLAALVEVHRLELTAAGAGTAVGGGVGAGAAGAGVNHRH